MAKPTEQAVEIWDLSKMLAVLCRIAQDARDAQSMPEASQERRIALELPATDPKGSRP